MDVEARTSKDRLKLLGGGPLSSDDDHAARGSANRGRVRRDPPASAILVTVRDFSVLSDVEFEELVADLLAAELGQPVERFAVGRDGGIDLRWQNPRGKGNGKGIGQCKHYHRSTFSQLLAAARAEVPHLELVKPHGYRFITSADLTVGQKEKLYTVFSEWMTGVDDVLGGRDVDGLLTRHEAVERRHPKLWLSTGSQLFWATHSDIANRASALKARIAASLPKYVLNRGYRDARTILDEHRVCVIAGVPGIGKTMLAQVLLADAMSVGYEPIEVSGDIDEAWTALRPDDLQVFLYDDFLGQLSFAERLGKNEDARLAAFIAKVTTLTSKTLIMTTREYILHDAQRVYERLSALDERMHFVLALSDYTHGDRARILYNHLWHADVSRVGLVEVASGGYRRIVDHPHYSPRLIEYGTSALFDTHGSGYVDRFVDALDHPSRLWKTAFETHLTIERQLLAVTLATMPPPTRVEDLQNAYAALCRHLSIPITTGPFRAALDVMEGTFVAISKFEREPTVGFHNPSIREFTLDWLADDPELLAAVLESVTFFEQLRQIYAFATGVFGRRVGQGHPPLKAILEAQADRFNDAVVRMIHSPCPERRNEWVTDEGDVYRHKSSWFEDRLSFLLGLTPPWVPSTSWFTELLTELGQRWSAGQGWKAEAVDLMRRLTAMAADDEAAIVIPADVLDRIGRTLDEWLDKVLEDTESDWTPYLERLRRDRKVVLARETELAQRFESFAQEELWRWSPSPPAIAEILDYAREFGLGDLQERLEEKIAEDEERDRETSSKVRDQARSTTSSSADDRESDGALDRLFGRLTLLPEAPEEEE